MQNAIDFIGKFIRLIKGLIKDLITIVLGSPSGFKKDSISNTILIHVDSIENTKGILSGF